jgi:hypothetical protein
MKRAFFTLCMLSLLLAGEWEIRSQNLITVRFEDSGEVLTNPGIGFMTFQRFNGDKTNEGVGWTEGMPVDYQEFKGSLEVPDHPMTSIAYFRVYWKYVEPEMGKYNWEMIDRVLRTAHDRKQTLLLRIAPYGSGTKSNDPTDVPAWYRKMVGEKQEWLSGETGC